MPPRISPPDRHNTCGLLLAGGRSVRMGQAKALLPWGEQRLLDHTLHHLQSQCEQVLISTNTPWGDIPVHIPQLPDSLTDAGPLAGILRGLEWLQAHSDCRWLLSCAVDTPHLPHDLRQRLSAAWQPGCALVVSVWQTREHPTCSLWHSSLATPLRAALLQEERRMLGFIHRTGYRPASFNDYDSDPFCNLNTPADYARQQPLARN